MKKRTIIFLVVGVLILGITGCGKKTSVTYTKNDFSLMSDAFFLDDDYYKDYTAYDEPINYDLDSLGEFVKYYHIILNYEESYTSLSDEEKAAVITLAAGLAFPQSEDYVKKIAKKYFGVDDYELPLGKYSVVGSGDMSGEQWSVTKEDGFYKSSIIARGIDTYRMIDFYDMSEVDNTIVLKGNYLEENMPTNPSVLCTYGEDLKTECIKGYYEYTLEKIDDSLVLQSINYKSNSKFKKNAQVSFYPGA